MKDSDIKSTTFRARPSRLYEITRMLFSLSITGPHVVTSWSNVLVISKLCLDDICIYTPNINAMIGHIEMVFSVLKNLT